MEVSSRDILKLIGEQPKYKKIIDTINKSLPHTNIYIGINHNTFI